jgi:anti-sigma factor RsiW
MANHLTYEVLTRLVEGRASVLEEARAQRHLGKCGRCRSEREWLERIRGLPTSAMRRRFEPLEDAPAPRANEPEWPQVQSERPHEGGQAARGVGVFSIEGRLASEWPMTFPATR